MAKVLFRKEKDRAVIYTRLYQAAFRGNRVKGRIEDSGLKVLFVGKVDKLPETPEEAHNAIASLFNERPTRVKLGAVVLAENSKVKAKAWGIRINDVNSLFDRLSTLKFVPVDVKDLSDVYGMRIGEIKKAVKSVEQYDLGSLATKDRARRYKVEVKRAKVGDFVVRLVLKGRLPRLVLSVGGVKLYEGQVSAQAVDQYFKMGGKELVEEALYHLEGLVNLLGKAGNAMLIPGVVEAKVKDGKVMIRTASEMAVLPWGGYGSLVEFVANLRKLISGGP